MGNEKGIRFRLSQVRVQVRKCASTYAQEYPVRLMLFCCVYDVLRSFLPFLPFPPSAEREATTTHNGKVQAGRADIVSDITLFLPFPRSFLFPIKIQDSPRSCFVRLEFPSLVSPGFSLFGLFVCFLPSPSLLCAFPWLSLTTFSHFTPSKLPQFPCV